MIRELVSEVVGLSPYERRLLDMLKTGGASSEKRMYKFAKRRVSFEKNNISLFFSLCFYDDDFVLIIIFTARYAQKSLEEERSNQGCLLQNESSRCLNLVFSILRKKYKPGLNMLWIVHLHSNFFFNPSSFYFNFRLY